MDQKNFENTKRIAKNTVYLYGRMLFSMFVSLYTSRVILNALGEEDYGVYSVVGGFVAMFSLMSSALSSSISRFMTYELGSGNMNKLKSVFSTSILIQGALSVIVILAAETVGFWFVNYNMVIPPERLVAANWVFQASILSFVLGLFSSPFHAAIVAHEKMDIYAYIGIFQTLIGLGIVIIIANLPYSLDRMITYSLLIVGVGILVQCFYFGYCHKNFEECRQRPRFDKTTWKEMSGFAGWNGIGCAAGILKDQGVNILLNLFFGPIVNAARAISCSVSGAIGSFTSNFLVAVSPQITKSYAANDRGYALQLVARGSRFGYYITMILAIPVILEAPFMLTLWLKEFPANAVIFVRLVLFNSLIEVLSTTLITLQVATGKIRNYQLAVGGLLLMNFPVSWIVLKCGCPPYSVFIVATVIGVGCLLLRLAFLRKMVGLSMRKYLRDVVGNVCITTIAAVIVPLLINILYPSGFGRFVSVILTGIISGGLASLYLGCTPSERTMIIGKLHAVKSRIMKLDIA